MAPQQPSAGQYLRSDSGGSATRMLGDGPGADPGGLRERRRRCGPLWGSVAVMAILALQIASTTGLFVYFTMAISKHHSCQAVPDLSSHGSGAAAKSCH